MSSLIHIYLLLLSCFIDVFFDWLNLPHRGPADDLWGLKDSIQANLSPRLGLPDNPDNTDIDYFVSAEVSLLFDTEGYLCTGCCCCSGRHCLVTFHIYVQASEIWICIVFDPRLTSPTLYNDHNALTVNHIQESCSAVARRLMSWMTACSSTCLLWLDQQSLWSLSSY